jgi:hypothetical protein
MEAPTFQVTVNDAAQPVIIDEDPAPAGNQQQEEVGHVPANEA